MSKALVVEEEKDLDLSCCLLIYIYSTVNILVFTIYLPGPTSPAMLVISKSLGTVAKQPLKIISSVITPTRKD